MGVRLIPAALLACAPNIAPVTLEAVIRVESGGNPLALNVNGVRVQPPTAKDAREAARIAVRRDDRQGLRQALGDLAKSSTALHEAAGALS